MMLIDTYPDFLRFWSRVRQAPMDEQIEAWAAGYMAPWPELLAKQIDCYAEDGLDWRQVAREWVFPYLEERAAAMSIARDNLMASLEEVAANTKARLGFEAEVNFVIYVGIGCGAGWATDYGGKPAVLFGLENIADCGWTETPALTGLIAHEIGHLYHFWRRSQQGVVRGSGPLWQLYSEGFAQRCEHLALGEDTWHMRANHPDAGWLDWCRENRNWLAAQFLDALEGEGDNVRPFFGSWYDIAGYKQTGYFLGYELVRALEAERSLDEIALLEDYEGVTLQRLRRLAAG